ncbi:MAG TPA: VOC family protein [Bacteroidota bacterium]|nr:VOC family protein [Bacteroidota bacterium]
MGAPIVHWEINTRNPSKVFDFYKSLFGWQINSAKEMEYGLVLTGSKQGINGGIGGSRGDAPNLLTVYAEVDDPQETLNRAVSMGATVVVPVTEIPNMVTFAQFRDPDGNIFGIVKSTERASTRRKKKPARRRSGKGRTRRRGKK